MTGKTRIANHLANRPGNVRRTEGIKADLSSLHSIKPRVNAVARKVDLSAEGAASRMSRLRSGSARSMS